LNCNTDTRIEPEVLAQNREIGLFGFRNWTI
jgi:hypothetical protein